VKVLLRTLLVLVVFAAGATATTIVPMSVEDLTRSASDVIEAHAVRSWSSWNAQHTLIYTYTTFEVQSRLKGSAPEMVTVKQVGGSAGGYTQKVSGVRQFQEGENALLFLRPSVAADGTLVVVGLVQGNFRVYQSTSGDPMVSNGVTGAQQYDHGRIETFSGTSLRLTAVEARVKRSVQ
jgi:hypothetical protein